MYLTKILFIFSLICDYEVRGLFQSTIKRLHHQAKNAYKKKFGKDKTWNFLGYDLSEYPGTNEKYRRLNQDKWDAYYKCLSEQDINEELTLIPQAILGFEHNSIEFECNICLSPSEISAKDSAEWKFAPTSSNVLESLEFSENVLLLPEDRSLRMYNLQLEQTGQYVCEIGEAQSPPYFLTIIPVDDDKIRKVHTRNAPSPPYRLEPQIIRPHRLILDTQWGPWSACSRCNQVGRKFKLGYCLVTYQTDEDVDKETNIIKGDTEINKYQSLEIPEEDYELLRIFQGGIPCKSHIIPYSIKSAILLTERQDEAMFAFCKVQCPNQVIFEVKDRNGKILETANNSAGIYSMLQGPPPPEPSVERQLIFGIKDNDIVISCPGNLNSDNPIEWQIGSKKVVPELLSLESHGRIYISITDQVHIKQAKVADSNIYSCWQMNELAGTVRLIVEVKIQLKFNHHIMLIGLVIIWLVLLYVTYKAFVGRKHALNK